ncbi:MAG: 30S ribosomal protein S14 [Rickettsiales bacterium]|jgi:small subunit ribosomal protein S14|nr:30S ribosomal protein S14 [Rickettsiales bacterium]
MAKLSLILRQEKRVNMVRKYAKKHDALKEKMSVTATPEERIDAMKKMAKMPRNANKTRLHNRCAITGRSRSYMGQFGLCRQQMRQLASEGKLPGVRKSSW